MGNAHDGCLGTGAVTVFADLQLESLQRAVLQAGQRRASDEDDFERVCLALLNGNFDQLGLYRELKAFPDEIRGCQPRHYQC